MKSVVAMFCGPHDEENDLPRRRIDKAIQVALEHTIPLLIAGDGNNRQDIDVFMEIARGAEVRHVVGLYDPRANTLADAECVVRQITHHSEFARVRTIYLVTDYWHMLRAKMMLESMCLKYRLRVQVMPAPVVNGPTPPEAVLAREQQGIEDFLVGQYGQRPAQEPYGKPALANAK